MNGETKRKFDLEERLINFSVRILNVVETMPETRSGNHIAGQLRMPNSNVKFERILSYEKL